MTFSQTFKAKLFIHIGTGTVGDFITNTDLAEKFHRATKTPVVFFTLKKGKGFSFCREMARNYDFLSLITLDTPGGFARFLAFYLKSFFTRCFMHSLIDDPLSLKLRFFLNFMIYASPVRVSLYNFALERFYLDTLSDGRPMHKRYDAFHLDLLRDSYGLDIAGIPAEAGRIPAKKLSETAFRPGRYIVITALASLPSKSRSPEQWAESIRTLMRHFPEDAFVFVGAPSAEPYYRKIAGHFDEKTREKFFDRIGRQDFDALCSVITHARLFVGLQSGLSHIAFRQHVPAVLFSADVQDYFEISRGNFINLVNLKNCKCRAHDYHYCRDPDYFACTKEVSDADFEAALVRIESGKALS